MPIDVVCSKCGGTGKIECLHFDPPHWRPEEGGRHACQGSGKVRELSFGERRRQAREFAKAQENRCPTQTPEAS